MLACSSQAIYATSADEECIPAATPRGQGLRCGGFPLGLIPTAMTPTRPPGFVTRTNSASIRSASPSSRTVQATVTMNWCARKGSASALPSCNASSPSVLPASRGLSPRGVNRR